MSRRPLGKTDVILVTMYPEVGSALRKTARGRGISMGDLLTELLTEHLGMPLPPMLVEAQHKRYQALSAEQVELASA